MWKLFENPDLSVSVEEVTLGQGSGTIIVVKLLARSGYFELMCVGCGLLWGVFSRSESSKTSLANVYPSAFAFNQWKTKRKWICVTKPNAAVRHIQTTKGIHGLTACCYVSIPVPEWSVATTKKWSETPQAVYHSHCGGWWVCVTLAQAAVFTVYLLFKNNTRSQMQRAYLACLTLSV